MFCACDNRGEDAKPNTTVCPICMGHPGTLPVLNRQAMEWGVLTSLALGCEILPESRFARKNYFYPDLPKGYQISMFESPVGERGKVILDHIPAAGKNRKEAVIGLTRLHLEDDAAKSLHSADGKSTLVDYNRAGTPLMEIVSEPDMRSPLEAKIFLQELRRIVRYLGVSDADMEKGHLRCDANISLRPIEELGMPGHGKPVFFPKTEIKNINSFRSVERALEYEYERQRKLWEEGKRPDISSTRGWDDTRGVTMLQRLKESSDDYRYFPEPDIPPLHLREIAEKIATHIPELPAQKRLRFREEYGISAADALVLTDDKAVADYTEQALSELQDWVRSTASEGETADDAWEKNKGKIVKLFTGWFTSKLFGLLEKHAIDIRIIKITPENFAEFITLVHQGRISGPVGFQILEEMLMSGEDPSQILEEKGLEQISSEDDLAGIVEDVIEKNADTVGEYKNGKETVLMFLVGQVMKATQGKANPETVARLLKKRIKQDKD